MAWTAPMTVTDGQIFTAAQFNSNIRDNFLETAPAKATSEGGYFVAAGLNSLVQRFPVASNVDTTGATTSSTFTDLNSAGPSVTLITGTRALVTVGAALSNGATNGFAIMGVEISGATTLAASDTKAFNVKQTGLSTGQTVQACWTELYTNLTPGTNTFTAKYRAAGDTATFFRRRLIVIPF